ncbi:prepilin-type N-terminal cleavage/methylation domain-containing protein [Candidatus Parcubacteria bacterium]|nr:prepilin-type N-terminal cleavage/methylation domain-containing protein [Candidatus Parcubacteria bacterium]MCK5268213.1 prepilin-type N-terminal cleavage/methylation domain-containing protein [Spirochaetota bacterium]
MQTSENKNPAGFTLIELLVVISIIGLLGSIVLASLGGAKDQAALAKAKEFSHTVRVSLANNLVGEWKFDDGSNPTRDSSGNENHGDLINDPQWIDHGIFGKALEFSGANWVQATDLSSDARFDETSNFTYSAWVKLDSDFSSRGNIMGTGLSWQITFSAESSQKLMFRMDDSGLQGGNTGPLYSNTVLEKEKWYHVVATYVGEGTNNTTVDSSKIYINGELDNSGNIYDPCSKYSYICFGHEERYSYNLNGFIDDVQIYNKVLSFAEVQHLYAKGAVEHGLVYE